jgi:hypothetical protein
MKPTPIFLFVLMVAGLCLASCSKDKDCDNTSLATAIVGSWDVIAFGINSGEIEFREDGTLIDPNDVLIGYELNGVPYDQKSYETIGDTILVATATDGNGIFEFEFDVTSYSCEEIEIDVIGIPATLRRN